MTESEAKEVLQLNMPLVASKEANKAVEVAINALEQQIAKRPVETEEFTEGGWIGKCPNCCSDCNDVMNYCDQCGQRLDWEV